VLIDVFYGAQKMTVSIFGAGIGIDSFYLMINARGAKE
jgi:hypothetical protein